MHPFERMVAFCRQRPRDRPLNCCQMNPKTLAGSYSIVLKLRPLQRNKGNCCAKWVDDYGPKILNYDVNSDNQAMIPPCALSCVFGRDLAFIDRHDMGETTKSRLAYLPFNLKTVKIVRATILISIQNVASRR